MNRNGTDAMARRALAPNDAIFGGEMDGEEKFEKGKREKGNKQFRSVDGQLYASGASGASA